MAIIKIFKMSQVTSKMAIFQWMTLLSMVLLLPQDNAQTAANTTEDWTIYYIRTKVRIEHVYIEKSLTLAYKSITITFFYFQQDGECPTSLINCNTITELYNVIGPPYLLDSNTELRFLPGKHELWFQLYPKGDDYSYKLSSHIDKASEGQTAQIDCLRSDAIVMSDVAELEVQSLEFHECTIHSSIHGSTYENIDVYNSLIDALGPERLLFRKISFIGTRVSLTNAKSNEALFINCTFIPNYAENNYTSTYIFSHNSNMNITDTAFIGAIGSAVYAVGTTINLEGEIVFRNNTGTKGGAITLYSSHIQFQPPLNASFLYNHASSVGGAIFSSDETLITYLLGVGVYPTCSLSCNSRRGIKTRFINNTARNGGSSLYGITMNSLVCTSGHCPLHNATEHNEAFSFYPHEPSVISSDPIRVCICKNNTHHCEIQNQTLATVFSGQAFNLSIAVVGILGGTVGGTVEAKLIYPHTNSALGTDFEEVQTIGNRCTDTIYRVHSDQTQETIMLETVSSLHQSPGPNFPGQTILTRVLSGYFLKSPLLVNVSILDCPHGFQRSAEPPIICRCHPTLTDNGISEQQCDINTKTIIRNGTVWISYYSNNQTNASGPIIHKHCPFGFCKKEQVAVDLDSHDLESPDIQCSQNRSGVLCGKCMEGQSLLLGTLGCLKCENTYLALIVVFVIAGLLLVLVLKLLNLTVSVGTLSGLIFYANIVHANQDVFFSSREETASIVSTVFLSWLNLDFGIKACFFDGLDGYWYTWLQFLFPVYIWTIAGGIVLVASISTRFTRLVGNNSVPVLATLLLLSYGKVLGTVINIYSVASIEYPDGSTHSVWAVDGNIPYWGIKHTSLFIVATVFILFLGLPLTLVLISGHSFKKITSYKGMRWLTKVNLFLNAYYGPYKVHRASWVGILLLMRIILYTVFAVFYATDNAVNMLSIATCTALLSTTMFGFPYKKKWLSVLESSFFLNLTILTIGTFYIELTGRGGKDILVGLSVGAAFIKFLGILAYHIWTFALKCNKERITHCVSGPLNTRGVYVRLNEGGEQAATLNLVDLDSKREEDERDKAVTVTQTIVDRPIDQITLSVIEDTDEHITGTKYTT